MATNRKTINIDVLFNSFGSGDVSKQFKNITSLISKFSGKVKESGGITKALEGSLKSLAGTAGTTSAAVANGAAMMLSGFKQIGEGIKQLGRNITDLGTKWVKSTKEMTDATRKLSSSLRGSVDGLRQIFQGLLSVGRALTFFVSIPVTAFLKKATEQSFAFEQQLVRIAKVMNEDVQEAFGGLPGISAFIQDVASVSISSQEELALFAEQLGQLGLQDVEGMKELIILFDMFAVATDVSANTVANSLGSIANAFGKSLSEESTDALRDNINWLNRLAETINKLENTTSTNAGKIITALQDAGSGLGQLGVPAAVIAGWAALGQAMGLSAAETGTALQRIPDQLARHTDQVFKLVGATQVWANETELITSLNNDFVGTMEDIIHVISRQEDAVTAIGVTTQIFGTRGAKLVRNLAVAYLEVSEFTDKAGNSQSRYTRVMNEALDAFESSNTLADEYNRVMASASGQTQILRNNIKNLGLTIGAELLPVLGELAGKAVPFIRALSDIFKDLSPRAKKALLLLAALAAVAGPLAFFFNQIAFGIILAIQGLTKLALVIPAVIGWIAALVKGLLALNPVSIAIAVTFAFMYKTLKDGAADTASTVIKILTKLADSASKWGSGLMSSFADGIRASGGAVIGSLMSIINIIAGFIQSFSPPRKGPLSNIDTWGTNLMNTYLGSFLKADFGILKKVTGIIQGVFTALNFNPDQDVAKQTEARARVLSSMIGFREKLTQLLSDFRTTGDVSEEAMDILVSGLGNASDEVKNLIKETLKYLKILAKIKKIEISKKDVLNKFATEAKSIADDEVMSAEEKVEALALAQHARDGELRTLNKQEESLQEQADLAKENVEWQQELLSTLQDQSDLWMELLTVMKDVAKSSDETTINLPDLSVNSDALGEFNSRIKELNISLLGLQTKALKARIALTTMALSARAMFMVLTGKADMTVFDTIEQEVRDIVGLEAKILQFGETFLDSLNIDAELAKTDPAGALRTAMEAAGLDSSDIRNFFGPFGDASEINEILSGIDFATALGLDEDTATSIGAAFSDTLVEAIDIDINFGSELSGTKLSELIAMNAPDDNLFSADGLVANLTTEFATLTEGLRTLTTGLKEDVQNFFKPINAAWEEHGEGILKSLSGIGGDIASIFNIDVGDDGVASLGELIAGFIGHLDTFLAWVDENDFGALLDDMILLLAASKLLGGPIITILGGIAMVGVGAVILAPEVAIVALAAAAMALIITLTIILIDILTRIDWEAVRKHIEDKLNAWAMNLAWDWFNFTEGLADLIAFFGILIELLRQWIEDKINAWGMNLAYDWFDFKEALSAKWEEVKEAIATKLLQIIAMFVIWGTDAATAMGKAAGKVKTKIEEKVAEWKTAVTDKLDEIKTAIGLKVDDWKTAGGNLIQGLIDGFASNDVIKAITGIATSALEAWNTFWDNHSPSRVAMDSAADIMKGFSIGFEDNAPETIGIMAEIGSGTLSAFMPNMLAGALVGNNTPAPGAGGIHVVIDNTTVQDAEDIDNIVEQVIGAIEENFRDTNNLGGA